MKKKEKRLILTLVILLVVVCVVAVCRKNKKEKNVSQDIPSLSVGENGSKTETPEVKEESYVKELEDGTKVNTSEALKTTKKVDDLEFTNIQLTNKDGQTVLLADVTNTGTTATEMTLVDVVILDSSGNEIGKVGRNNSPIRGRC